MSIYNEISEQIERYADKITKSGLIGDKQDKFATENYQQLKEMKFFSAMTPEELGGGGVNYSQMCKLIKQIAQYHPSTALSASMHQHIIAANHFNYVHGKPGQAVLEKVIANELVLVSTGAGDWLASNGTLTKTEGGFLFSATKHFASGSPEGDVLVTSGPYEDPDLGWQVFHFPVPTSSKGVKVLDNWHPMGMKGTGSNSVEIDEVFIPEASIALRRPRGDYHTVWCVVLPVALPLIMSVYVGIAETAAIRAKALCKELKDLTTPYLLGEMENALTTAQVVLQDMIANIGDFDFTPDMNTLNEVVKRKTIVANHCKQVVVKAIEACGGSGYLESFGIECLLRDVMASHFHPMQEKRQHLFSGYMAVEKTPPSAAF